MSNSVTTVSEAQRYAAQTMNINRDNDPVYMELVTAKVSLLLSKPFFGILIVRMDLVESPWCRTAATDGRKFYYNREFIKNLPRQQLLFLMGHELLHCIFDHLGRKGRRDVDLWNMACDYVINATLVQEKMGEMIPGGLLKKEFTAEMSADEVYEILRSKSVTIELTLDDHLELEDEDEDGGGDGGGDGDGDSVESADSSGGGGSKQRTVKVTIMGDNGVPKLTKEDLEKTRAELKSALLQTVQQVGAGNVPLGVQRLIKELTEPKMNWRTLLDAHIRSAVKDDYTHQRIGRKTWGSMYYGNNFVLPAQNFMDRVEVVCPIDASGSTTNEMVRDFLSEVKGIMETFRDYEITVFSFDTECYNLQKFTPENMDDIHNYTVNGGGGTSFEEVFAFMKREGIEPHRLAFFTDGLPNEGWGDPNYCDTIFIIHGNKTIEAPFGITCHYEDDRDMRN